MLDTQSNKPSTATSRKAQQYADRQALAESMPNTGKVRANQCAAYLNIGLSTFWAMVYDGRISKPVKYGTRMSVWDAEYIRDLAANGIPAKGEAA